MKRAKAHLYFQFKLVPDTTKDASQDCVIEGYANTSTKDRVGDVVLPVAFEKSLPTYLDNPVLLLNHNWDDVAGVTQTAEITDKGLFIRARISDTRPDLKTQIREGCLRTFSIGYNELDADFDEASKTKVIKALELLEISIVSVPANPEAKFQQIDANTVVAAPKEPTAEESAAAVRQGDQPAKSAPIAAGKSITKFVQLVCDVKSALEVDELDEETINALTEHFNTDEDVMTKKELIEALKNKTAVAAPATTTGKADPAPAEGAAPAAGSDDLAKAIAAMSAKMDAIAEALAQLLSDESAEGEPAGSGAGSSDPAAEAGKAATPCEKCGKAEFDKSADAKEETCKGCGAKRACVTAEPAAPATDEGKSAEELLDECAELEAEIEELSA